jgi:hypothetical protein
MKREDIAAGSRVARIRRDGRLAHTRDTPNPPARPARSPRSAPRRGLSHGLSLESRANAPPTGISSVDRVQKNTRNRRAPDIKPKP